MIPAIIAIFAVVGMAGMFMMFSAKTQTGTTLGAVIACIGFIHALSTFFVLVVGV